MLSMYHFQIVPSRGTQNKVVEALSRRPDISNVTIAYNQDLERLRESYATDLHLWQQMQEGQSSILNERWISYEG